MSRGQPYSNKTLIFWNNSQEIQSIFHQFKAVECLTFHVLLDKIPFCVQD